MIEFEILKPGCLGDEDCMMQIVCDDDEACDTINEVQSDISL